MSSPQQLSVLQGHTLDLCYIRPQLVTPGRLHHFLATFLVCHARTVVYHFYPGKENTHASWEYFLILLVFQGIFLPPCISILRENKIKIPTDFCLSYLFLMNTSALFLFRIPIWQGFVLYCILVLYYYTIIMYWRTVL